MAITKAIIKRTKQYDAEAREIVYAVALDSSYPTGGEEVDFSSDFPRGLDTVWIGANNSGYHIIVNSGTRAAKFPVGKCDLGVFQQSAATGPLTECPPGTNLSAVILNVIVKGPTF